jgi:aspartate/methionine/tyrosine aminotransferase
MVSDRATSLTAGSPAIATAHFRCESEPYHPEHRPGGCVNLGTAENRLVWDLLEPRLSARRPPAAQDLRYAPLHGIPRLREAVAEHLSRLCHTTISADEVVVVSGATAALDIAASVLCNPGEAIVLPAPYYGAFDVDLAGRSGARLVPAPTGHAGGFRLSPEAVGAAIDRARRDGVTVRAITLASPSNPVGHVYPAALLGALAAVASRHGVDIITDEIYAGSVFDPASFVSLVDPAANPDHRERTHLVWGFAKDFGLPGLKVGVLYSPDPDVIAAARAMAYFAPVSTDTQALLADLLADRPWVEWFAGEARARLVGSYERCAGLLAAADIPYLPAEAGFAIWADLRHWLAEPTFGGERALWQGLFETAQVNVMPGEAFACPEPGWFRVCHATDSAALATGITRLGRGLRELAPRPARAGGRSTGGPFAAWYEVAGVRSGVRRILHREAEQGKVFYPAALVPYLSHEAVKELAPARIRDLTIRHLYQFLLSTTHLETRVVNRGAERIANGRIGLDLALPMRMDAFKVYCDEGYHALYSLDLADQIAAVTGVAIPDCDYGRLVDRLEEVGDRLLPADPVLAQLLQVVVFETLVTAVLNEVPNDETVIDTVRDLTRDHARDEGRHHRFFSAFFHELWTGLDRPRRERVARTMPALIHGCLVWDVEPIRSSLELAGLDPRTAGEVIADCYGGDAGQARIADIARATVRMCESAGVLDVPGAREAFAGHGFITGG